MKQTAEPAVIVTHIENPDSWSWLQMDERRVRVDMAEIRLSLNIGLLQGCKGSRRSAVLVPHNRHNAALLHGHKVVTLCREAGPGLRR